MVRPLGAPVRSAVVSSERQQPAVPGEPAGAEARLQSSLPGSGARVLAFAAILVGGLCGGLIGYAVADLQCVEGCGGARAGLGAMAGAVIAASGVAVVAVLVLRAMAEWRTIEHTGDPRAARDTRRRRRR